MSRPAPAVSGRPVRRPERSPEKRRQILAGARHEFGAHGYERTSVDLVAARAGVSKATVYGHFEDKKALFLACFSEEADDLREGLKRAFAEAGGDPQVNMRRAGERLLKVLVSPAFVSLYVHTASEAERFPEVGEALFERGPTQVYGAVAGWLRRWEALGVVKVPDARAAAVQFVQLCHGDLVIRAQLGVTPRPGAAEIRATVRRAVAVFLRAYGG